MYFEVPIVAWATNLDDPARKEELDFIDPMMRRRLSTLSKTALAVARRCIQGRGAVRVVMSSRHGELHRTTQILESMCASEPVSPTAFSLSVLNAATGVLGIARADRSPSVSLSSGTHSLGYALLEGFLQYRSNPESPVLVVHGDEAVPEVYGPVIDDVRAPVAVALLIDERASGALECGLRADSPLRANRFESQAQAVHHTLASRAETVWSDDPAHENNWYWRWNDATQK